MDIHSSAQNEDIRDLASPWSMVVTRGTLTSPEYDSNFLESVQSIPQAIEVHRPDIGPLQCSLLVLKAYSSAKLGVRPSYAKWHKSEHFILTSNYVDRYNQLADTFLCFMVLVEVLTHWSHVTLLSTAYAAYTSTGSLPIL